MNRVNRGKDFEHEIEQALNRCESTSVDRLHDQMSGFKGSTNICDFIAYFFPNQFYLECKACYGNTLPFSNITETQWNGLIEKSKIMGVVAGYIVWFIDHDKTLFVPAEYAKSLKDSGAKSLNVKLLDMSKCFEISGKKRKIMFTYDMKPFLCRGVVYGNASLG